MFTSLDKALIALVMAILAIANALFGIVPPAWMSVANVSLVVGAITPVLVYMIPNKKA